LFIILLVVFVDGLGLLCLLSDFGIVGNGKMYILQITPEGLVPLNSFYTKDGLYAESEVA
jgi:peroxin-7